MLRLLSDAGKSRRDFLRVGGGMLGSLAWPGFLNAASGLGGGGHLPITDKSVVFMFMHGGPAQTETFDPKMSAPVEYRSATGAISTRIPGVSFGSTFPLLADRADKFTIVRSFRTGNGNHDIKPVVSKATFDANIGSHYSRIAGMNRPSGMPTNVALYPQAVDETTMPAIKQFGDFESTGKLGSRYAPFAPSGGGEAKTNMELHLPMQRLDDRRALLGELDRLQKGIDHRGNVGSIDSLRQQAY